MDNNLTNDEKAIDLNYESQIFFMGKKRSLGRSNNRMRVQLRRTINDYADVHLIPIEKNYLAKLDELDKASKAMVKKLISPITKAELDDVDIPDLEDLNRSLTRRNYKRRGLGVAEIERIEKAENKAIVDSLESGEGLEDFQKQEKPEMNESSTE